MNTIDKPYVTIKEAQEGIASRSAGWYRDKIDRKKIKASSEGKGSDWLIETKSLLKYLKSTEK